MKRKIFLPGSWGRPMALEQSIRRSGVDETRRWPNEDAFDPYRHEQRVPDVSPHSERDMYINDKALYAAYYEQMIAEIDRYKPDLILCSLNEDADIGRLRETLEGCYPIMCSTYEASRLEEDRWHARKVCEEHGIDASKMVVINSKDRVDEVLAKHDLFNLVVDDGSYVVKPRNSGGVREWAVAQMYHGKKLLKDGLTRRPESEFPVVVEEFLSGIEVAFSCLVDYRTELIIPMVTDFEYTTLCAGDIGPQTSDMGSNEVAGVGPRAMEMLRKLLPWFKEVRYQGFFDASCMYNPSTDRLAVFEFMTRLGMSQLDSMLMMLGRPFHQLIAMLLNGTLTHEDVTWSYKHGVSVAVHGYDNSDGAVIPNAYLMNGATLRNGRCVLSRAETKLLPNGEMVVVGDRSKNFEAVGVSNDFEDAQQYAYHVAKQCSFAGAVYRNDIGHRWANTKAREALGGACLLPNWWWR